MSALSDHMEQQLINCTLRGGTYTGSAVYVALHQADPTDEGLTNTEVTDSGYARQVAHTATPSDGFTSPVNGVTTNTKIVQYPAIIDATIIVTHWALWDAPTGGNLVLHEAMTNPKTLDATDVMSFPVGSISVTAL